MTAPLIVFRGPELTIEVRCTYDPNAGKTLLELAQEHGVPLHWRCGHGTCGTCAVRVCVAAGSEGEMGRKERNVLAREGLGAGIRLACSYVPVGESLVVEL